MTHPNPSTALARVVVDELSARGVEVMVIAPGSRSGALAIAAAQDERIRLRVMIDERSAAFHALGVALASRRPAAVVSTSGTAVANFLPAVVEADLSCVPLLLVSADRPAEMHGIGANQTIDQIEIFGSKVRAFAGIDSADPARDQNDEWRRAVAGLVSAATSTTPGPAHLNIAFREPTVPVSDDGRTVTGSYPFPTPRITGTATEAQAPSRLDWSRPGGRGLVLAGDGRYDRSAVTAAAARLGWPVVATALSGLRGSEVVSSYRRLLRDGIPERMTPGLVLAIGSLGPDPILESLFASAPERYRIDAWGRSIDPGRNATEVFQGDAVAWLAGVSASTDEGWRRFWLESDRVAATEIVTETSMTGDLTGGVVAEALNEVGWGALVVGSSLPIREIDAHLRRSGPVFANRGASGIDGFVSTALGVASAIPATAAVCGDLTLLHDSNGFLHDSDIDLTLIVMDNNGGGLFDSLPQALHAPEYERLFVAPHDRDLATLAAFHGLPTSKVSDPGDLVEVIDASMSRRGTNLVLVPIDRAVDVEARRQLFG